MTMTSEAAPGGSALLGGGGDGRQQAAQANLHLEKSISGCCPMNLQPQMNLSVRQRRKRRRGRERGRERGRGAPLEEVALLLLFGGGQAELALPLVVHHLLYHRARLAVQIRELRVNSALHYHQSQQFISIVFRHKF